MLVRVGFLLGAGILASACPQGDVSSPQVCKDYVACAYLTGTPPPSFASLDSTFGANGSCWISADGTVTSADVWQACTAACDAAVHRFKSSGQGADAGCTFAPSYP
jgi:hypothetical protein